jgi:L-threonylcarbamoyladenylate synthase
MTSVSRITTDVALAARVLLDGGIIGLPTETVYGLAALANNENAVRRVFSTKGRPSTHPLIVHLGTDVDPHAWGVFNENAEKLARAFWPGPLTLLVPRTPLVSDWVTGGRHTVAIRVPSHPVAQALLNAVQTGVVAPSANRFGKVSPTTAQHVLDDLGTEVDLILDGGPSQVGVESTIVECVDNKVRVLRPGLISSDELRTVIDLTTEINESDSRAPGMLASHYAPQARVLLFENLVDAMSEMKILTDRQQRCSLLHHDNLDVYAENLYADLRLADSEGVAVICAVLPPNIGVGSAIRDRLHKASHR